MPLTIVRRQQLASELLKKLQGSKLGVVASTTTPKVYEFPIPETVDFKRDTPVEVLKFVPGTANTVQTICNFDNADSTSFVADPMVEFNGKMQLKTSHNLAMKDEGALGTGKLWSAPIDLATFKVIEKVMVS